MHFNINKGGDFICRAILQESGEVLRWEAETISRVPEERLIVAYTLYSGETKVRHLIGKFYDGTLGYRAYQAMCALQKTLSEKSNPAILAFPRPFFYDAPLDLIVQEFVEGLPYYDLIEGARSSFYFLEAGKALATLHRLKVEHGERRSLSDHLEELIHPHPMLFADILPAYRSTVEGLIHEMMRIEASWNTQETVPIHRDFHLRQLFHDEKQVWLIDWDLLALGDPALDVGNFIVYLETRLKENHDTAISAFLEGYAPHARLERVPVYKALTYLRLACKRFRLKEDHWREQVSAMLHQSELALKGGLYA